MDMRLTALSIHFLSRPKKHFTFTVAIERVQLSHLPWWHLVSTLLWYTYLFCTVLWYDMIWYDMFSVCSARKRWRTSRLTRPRRYCTPPYSECVHILRHTGGDTMSYFIPILWVCTHTTSYWRRYCTPPYSECVHILRHTGGHTMSYFIPV